MMKSLLATTAAALVCLASAALAQSAVPEAVATAGIAAPPVASPRLHSPAPRASRSATARAPVPTGVSANYEQMSITAKSFELDGKSATITFTGEVRVDFRATHIECQKAVVYSTRSADRVLKIVMSGSVLVQQKMGSFRGSTVTYFPNTERLLVEGNTQTKIKVEKGVPLFQ